MQIILLGDDIAFHESAWENIERGLPGCSSDGVLTVDHNWRIMSLNRAAEEITGISRDLGLHKSTLFRKIKSLGIVLPEIDGRSETKI